MASIKFKKDSAEFKWFGEFWKIVQKYWLPEKNDLHFFENAFEDLSKMYDKYNGNTKLDRFSRVMILAFMNFLDGEAKIENKK